VEDEMNTAVTTGIRAVRKRLRAELLTLLVLACRAATAEAQEAPLRLKNPGPAGARSSLTESWGVVGFRLSNTTNQDREARVLTFYSEAPGRQFGRDLWVPRDATLSSWYSLGPPPGPTGRSVVELRSLLYDRTEGRERLLKSPEGQATRSDLVRFERREPSTAVMLDGDVSDGSQVPPPADAQARADDLRDLVRVWRNRWGLSATVHSVKQRFLPPIPEALDGIDHFVLGSDRIGEDAAGLRALRAWLEGGGFLWVPLDLVAPRTVAALLGDGLEVQVVDRISLTTIHVRNGSAASVRPEAEAREVEEPVDFVRVLAPRQRALHTVDGWPAAFVTEFGRGRVLFTTLGARGWMRPRTDRDPPSTYRDFPRLPVALLPFEYLAEELHESTERPPLAAEELRSYVTEQVSYSVVGRGTVVVVFGLFFLALLGATVALGRKRLLEHLGWLGPALAVAAAAVFVGVGVRTRGAVPPTVAVAQVVDAVPGLDEVQTTGYFAVYQPSLNASAFGAEQGGQFELDLAGLEGRVHPRVQTDADRWHLENLELPAGVRLAPFRHTLRTREPVEATVRFGPDGVEGRVTPGPFRQLEDALLHTPGRHSVAVRPGADGAFRAGPEDELSSGQFIVGGLLNDRQRTRQGLYEKLLAEPQPRYTAGRKLLLAWAEPADMHFTLAPQARTAGFALLVIPLRFERTSPGTRVTVPAAFVDYQRVDRDGRPLRLPTESQLPMSIRLRFQVPPTALPLTVDGARFTVHLHAPGREVTVGGYAGDEFVALRRLSGPLGPAHVEIDDPRLLRPDEQGALYVGVEIGKARGGDADAWRIESLGLEVRGRTVEKEGGEHDSR
jgi:hypothetical protein